MASSLRTQLQAGTPTAIQEFDAQLNARLVESYRWDLWAVAYLANGGSSDDGFDYFRGWLISRGQEAYNQALKDPPSAVAWTWPFPMLECEDILRAPMEAYQAKVGAPLPKSLLIYPSEPVGRRWSEDSLRSIYPGMVQRIRRWRWPYSWGY